MILECLYPPHSGEAFSSTVRTHFADGVRASAPLRDWVHSLAAKMPCAVATPPRFANVFLAHVNRIKMFHVKHFDTIRLTRHRGFAFLRRPRGSPRCSTRIGWGRP
jgi:hypothetical protein